jgi:exopolyphosphatase / guanosine-5'-triphosphate,3'-diphosphate pyrophosphatase
MPDADQPGAHALEAESPFSPIVGRHPAALRHDRHQRLYAALDLGTNNCRLLIAKPSRQGLQVVDAFSRIVRLGEGLAESGALSEEAQDRAVKALRICAEKLRRRDVRLARHVATEACRRARNVQGFVERVHAETGIALDVITAHEEARLAVLGCQSLFDASHPYALVFDIGGGSTELILAKHSGRGDAETLGWISIPWGVVSLSERFGGDAVSADDFAAMQACVQPFLDKFEARTGVAEKLALGQLQVLGTSGTVTTLASLHLGLPSYDRRQVDSSRVPGPALRALSNRLAGMSLVERAAEPCVGRDRADLVVAGCAILEAILGRWDIGSVKVADRGIREGVLRTLMRRDGVRW